jgi:hypothetical protein
MEEVGQGEVEMEVVGLGVKVVGGMVVRAVAVVEVMGEVGRVVEGKGEEGMVAVGRAGGETAAGAGVKAEREEGEVECPSWVGVVVGCGWCRERDVPQ